MNIKEFLKSNTLILDGGMGTLLQSSGLAPGELPERWNVTHPEVITNVHRSYFDAGSNVVATNTFGASILKFGRDELDAIVAAAVTNARRAANESVGAQPKWIALDVGPSGKMLKPYGDLDFERAVEIFAETVRLGVKYGVDLILIETMNDSYETKAALLAAKENSTLPVFVSNAYGEDGKLMTGADPAAMVALLEGMGADAIGVNCSLGPQALAPVVCEYLKYSSIPVILKPNAGLPRVVGDKTVYDVSPDEFASEVADLVEQGVRAVGGCCGTTPEYIAATARAVADIPPRPVTEKNYTVISSYTHAVFFGDSPILIGERINPTGKKRFKEALRDRDMSYILNEGIHQEEMGVHVLDVNVGLPEIDETEMLTASVRELQTVIDLPLQIDTSCAEAMEAALRIYNGKPMINSVSGKSESLDLILPLAKKYGGLIVALTLDENGIPDTAEGRVEIAKRILAAANEHGIDRKNIIFDPLALTVSADKNAAATTARAVSMIRHDLGCHTSLGVSNVSFGLPARDAVNATFFSMTLAAGLSAAIMNPYSDEMMRSYYAYRALAGLDDNCADYIAYSSSHAPATVVAPNDGNNDLGHAIIKGLKDLAAEITGNLIKDHDPLAIVREHVIPALDTVGVGFEKKKIYLPQLLMSAEAAKSAFDVIKSSLTSDRATDKCAFIIATVKGDIHDIGKNIVKLILENYGFAVTDLGRDVAPERIVDEAVKQHAPIVGLSALMTTTVPAMADTVRLLRERAPWCRIVVGGAVLNADYAAAIGADKYAADAMEAVRYAEEVNSSL